MHQREIDRAAGSAVGGTIAGLLVVFLLFWRYPKTSLILGALITLLVVAFNGLKAWDYSKRDAALDWPGYDLAILDTDRSRQETADFRKLMKEPKFFGELNSREFLVRFLPTYSEERYGKTLCEALFYRPGETKPLAVIMTNEHSRVCMSDLPEPVLGHWKNGVWRIASMGEQPLDYFQIRTLAELVSRAQPWESTYSNSDGASPWMRTMDKARWTRDWRTFYPEGEWVSIAFW